MTPEELPHHDAEPGPSTPKDDQNLARSIQLPHCQMYVLWDLREGNEISFAAANCYLAQGPTTCCWRCEMPCWCGTVHAPAQTLRSRSATSWVALPRAGYVRCLGIVNRLPTQDSTGPARVNEGYERSNARPRELRTVTFTRPPGPQAL